MKKTINIVVMTALFLVIIATSLASVHAEDNDDDGFRTPGYWKNHLTAWPMDYSTEMTLETVFTSTPSELVGTTLLQSLRLKGGCRAEGAQQVLMRAGVAALLNSATFGSGEGGYPLSMEQLISKVNNALNPGNRDSMLSLAEELDSYNNLGTS